ncbi:hypothetical protein [Bradyrhizobium sp. Ash2021]|uniref:hypothetical protein n=1 Tax=Bradyrhizobium sp. Ash2021 TaxID=2954771 RepID=UPI002815222B|nr:hypothetical protein [Bradyrhizobium sp. Ash2021]WMT79378.1 hypothetical protein NL528_09840 [Bradyrhizobium sp. Ash2021]
MWRFGAAADFAKVADFGDATRFGDLLGLDGPLKTSDSQPASLTSIGRSTNAAIAAMMVQRRGETPMHDPANFLPDDSNACLPRSDFPCAPDGGTRRRQRGL